MQSPVHSSQNPSSTVDHRRSGKLFQKQETGTADQVQASTGEISPFFHAPSGQLAPEAAVSRYGKDLASGTFLQTKLTVNTPGDRYEREADAMADRVMHMPSGGDLTSPSLTPLPGGVQRKCAACEEEEKKLQRKPLMRESAGGIPSVTPALSTRLSSSQGRGNALPSPTQSAMSQAFGTDFSDVRIHTDGEAVSMSRQLNARAFTHGSDIYFDRGEYAPASSEGKRLLGHELTHVVQQGTGRAGIQREGFGDVRIAEGYDQIKTEINASPKFQSLRADEKKLTGDIILEIEKKPDWPTRYDLIANLQILYKPTAEKASLDHAKLKILSLGLDATQVEALIKTLSKPLQGYVASGFDFSSRFFQHADPLGFNVENTALPSYQSGPYDRSQPAGVTDPAEKSFEKSDILFFSGHQYAQYGEPGTFTDDTSTSCFNIGMISKENKRVKLVVSTSCATICKDVAKIWRSKFPDALILGYRYSAPTNGGIVANAFASNLVKKGPIDLNDVSSLQNVRDVWKSIVLGKGSVGGGPALLYGGEVEFWSAGIGAWVKKPWDDKANECHYH
jgi:hypothetical protein